MIVVLHWDKLYGIADDAGDGHAPRFEKSSETTIRDGRWSVIMARILTPKQPEGLTASIRLRRGIGGNAHPAGAFGRFDDENPRCQPIIPKYLSAKSMK
jgi:hypothetical protein